jgi:deazaflavin-dependent oxidoreductase (nitroreductase family)
MMALLERPSPTGLLRAALRFPILLYRAHLGWLLGSRFLLLTHRGRNSGLPRATVLEVVHHDRASGAYFVASGWGEKSDWLRNVETSPEVTVHVGARRFAAEAERLSRARAQEVLCTYARHHPAAFRAIAKLMTGRRLRGTEEDCEILARAVPLVALRPTAPGLITHAPPISKESSELARRV